MAATDIVPISDVQNKLRAEDWERIDKLDSAAVDPVVALQAITGMQPNTLVYQFKVNGQNVVGLTVDAAKALAARRGDIEVMEPRIEPTTIQVETGNGDWMDVPAVRAYVRVKDLKTNTTFVGIGCQPTLLVKKDGSQRLDPMADRVAISKAVRNGILDHFTGIQDIITKFAQQAAAEGRAYIVPQADGEAEEVSRQIAIQKAKRQAMHSAPIGATGAAILTRRLKAMAQQAGMKDENFLVRELMQYVDSQWPGLKMADIGQHDQPKLEAWVQQKETQLGLDDEEGEADAEEAPGLPAAAEAADAGGEPEDDPETETDDDATDETPAEREMPEPLPDPRPARKGNGGAKDEAGKGLGF
jgi:hypothetical protein